MFIWCVSLLLLILGSQVYFLFAGADSCAANGVCTIKASHVKLPKGANAQGRPIEANVKECNDRHERCVGYQRQGECEKNPGWMIVNCPASCQACHLLDPKVRCNRETLNISSAPAYAPGEMEDVFSHLVENFGNRYNITVHSTDPWLVTFENFVSDRAADAIINSVHDDWERSTDTGTANAFGEAGRVLSQTRTSSNAWCRGECSTNPDVIDVVSRISEVTRIPPANSESFQILRYEVGQRYAAHHDSSESQSRLACGPRILTFFLYLSDVGEGGETSFPQLQISVKPKKGRAVLWPSTFSSEPGRIDGRTVHEAKPVIKGTKLAANAWIHLYDFEHANLWGCTGTFDNI